MKNSEALDQFEQANDAQINHLFWIAGSFESSELHSFLEDLEDYAWKDCLPEVFETNHFKDYQEDGELHQLLLEEDKLGFIAEVSYPKSDNFIFDESGKFSSCSLHPGTRRIRYVYAETTEVLLQKIEIAGQQVFNEYLEAEKRRMKRESESQNATV